MTLNEYCRIYRVTRNINLKDVGVVKNISAFEHGRSSNYKHFLSFLKIAKDRNELDEFIKGLENVTNE